VSLWNKIEIRRPGAFVPKPVLIYAGLGMLDLFFTLLAFHMGFQEGNPVLAWYQHQGLFEFAKVGSTIIVILLGFFLWNVKLVRRILYSADVLMFGVLIWHLFFWVGFLEK
jgi:hypothetical protein